MTFSKFFRNAVETHGRASHLANCASHLAQTHGHASQSSAHSTVKTHERASQSSAHSTVKTHGRASLIDTSATSATAHSTPQTSHREPCSVPRAPYSLSSFALSLALWLIISASALKAQSWPPAGMAGSGTEAEPWEIESHQHLKALADYVNAAHGNGDNTIGVFYRLENDLDLSPYQAGEGWDPIGYVISGTNRSYFQGNFDGNNKVISNLKIDRNRSGVGLFGWVIDATIENLGLIDAYIENGNYSVGSLVGYMEVSIVKNCYTENCYVAGNNTYIGGLIGAIEADNSIVQNCYANAEVYGSNINGSVGGLIGSSIGDNTIENCYSEGIVGSPGWGAGGLIGNSEGLSIFKNCYSTANVSADVGGAGGFIGMNEYSTIENCYATGNVQGDEHIGGFAGNNNGIIKNCLAANASVVSNLGTDANRMVGQNYATLTNNYALETMLVNGSTVAGGTLTDVNGADASVSDIQSLSFYNTASNWDGAAWDIDDPSGIWEICDGETMPFLRWQNITCANIILIYTEAELDNVRTNLNKNYILMNDLDLTSYIAANYPTDGWQPIGTYTNPFEGTFDGDNHKITGLFIDRPTEYNVGLFGYAKNTTLKNLGIENCDVTGYSYVGSLVGYNDGSSSGMAVIENCYATGMVTCDDEFAGGLVGKNDGNVGNATIENCYTAVDVTGIGNLGGLVGSNYIEDAGNASIENCYASGNITGDASIVGGLVGENSGNITNCYATGDMGGTFAIGGLIGTSNSGVIENCYASGTVTGTDVVGGLVGGHDGILATIINCFAANGSVSLNGTPIMIPNTVNRIIGYEASAIQTGCFNNYALSSMVLEDNGSPVTPTPDLNGEAGEDATIAQLQSRAFFETASNWNGDAWSIEDEPSSVWNICENQTLPWLRWQNIECPPTFEFCGGDGSETDPFQICTPEQLDAVRYVLDKHFILNNDIDLNIAPYNTGSGWEPIGKYFNPYSGTGFEGTFDGDGNKITGLFIDRPTEKYIGLFGSVHGATIKNLGIENCDVTGGQYTVGGLAGNNVNSTIFNCYASGTVTATALVGGLVGENYNNATISHSYSTCTVTGANYVGGLSGYNNVNSTIENCYATGTVTGNELVGGLTGTNESSSIITNCYATGTVTGGGGTEGSVAGLVGINDSTIENCYSTSDVTGDENVGGLVGYNYGGGAISNCVAANASITATTGANINRIMGVSTGGSYTLTNNYAIETMLVNGSTVSGGTLNDAIGADATLEQLQSFDFYATDDNWDGAAWDIEEPSGIWKICNNEGLPFMRYQNIICSYETTYIITASAGANGSITPSGDIEVVEGDNQTFTFSPNEGYQIEQVLVDGTNNEGAVLDGFYTFVNVTEEHTIHVTFKEQEVPNVLSVTISPNTVTLLPGETQQFTVVVDAVYGADESVEWTVTGNLSTSTNISTDGFFTVGNDETAETVTVTVTSLFNPTIYDDATVTVHFGSEPEVFSVTISPKTVTLQPSETQQFTVFVDAINGADESVEWSISGNETSLTAIDPDGLLTISLDEPDGTIIVRATSVFAPAIYDEATVTVKHVGIDVETYGRTSPNVYPNPTSGVFFVRHCGLDPQSPQNKGMLKQVQHDAALEIYDITGRIVHREPCTVHPEPCTVHRATVEIDISHLANGVYFVKIGNETIKIVKN